MEFESKQDNIRKNSEEIDKELKETEKILKNINIDEAIEYAEWIREKANIKFYKSIPNFRITSNYIYWCNLGVNIGSEQNKIRPVLILKTKKNSQICTILPLTTKRINDTRWYHVDLDNLTSTVLIEQLRNISKMRIIKPHRKKGKLSKITLNDWNKINHAIKEYYVLNDFK